jgi:hypothetical protein
MKYRLTLIVFIVFLIWNALTFFFAMWWLSGPRESGVDTSSADYAGLFFSIVSFGGSHLFLIMAGIIALLSDIWLNKKITLKIATFFNPLWIVLLVLGIPTVQMYWKIFLFFIPFSRA